MDPIRIWFDPPYVRWGRVVVTVLIVTVLVGLWVAQRRGLFEPARTPVVVAGANVASSPEGRAARKIGSAAVAMSSAASAPAAAASSIEVYCGLGPVTIDAGDEAQVERVNAEANEKLQAYRARVLPGWLEEMKSSPDLQVQAAAWFLEARDVWLKRTELAQPPESLDALSELARLAQRSRDPLIYALAYQSCDVYRPRATAPACDGLTIEAWAERDPGNAFPWLYGVGAQGTDALQRSRYAGRALAGDTIRSTWGALHPMLAKAAPPQEAPLDRSVRFWEAMSADTFLPVAQGGLLEHCKESELRQGARRQQCEHLAAFVSEKADTFSDAAFGRAIGKRLGWSEDRLARLRADTEALMKAMPADEALVGCEGLARGEAFFADVAKYGELGALRRRQQAVATSASR